MKAQWEKVDSNLETMHRLEVPGGWLVYLFYSYRRAESYGGDRGAESQHRTLVFYPDRSRTSMETVQQLETARQRVHASCAILHSPGRAFWR